MKRLKKQFSLFSAIVDAFVEPPETIRYPFEPLNLPAVIRGALVLDTEKCSGCGLCVRNCPADALELDKKSRDEFRLIHYPARCAYCGQCEDSCRSGAIYHTNQLVKPITDPKTCVVILHDKRG